MRLGGNTAVLQPADESGASQFDIVGKKIAVGKSLQDIALEKRCAKGTDAPDETETNRKPSIKPQ